MAKTPTRAPEDFSGEGLYLLAKDRNTPGRGKMGKAELFCTTLRSWAMRIAMWSH